MTTTGAQYALAASAGAGNGGGAPTAVGMDTKPSVVALTTSSSGNSSTCQAQSTRGQQVITVVTSPDPSSPNNLQPIQVRSFHSSSFIEIRFNWVPGSI